ncbi:hypothetical protein B7P43_G07804 [Cryptotermes secundus]|uniref:Uncharacterized protein n=1 Tax=Cryptotermes secundus TaxID=105785 RepID=A0A2J7QL73_9NEOP|nr:hypothetical protein B7P43_G07803 [Cryptotermes secundus]PNF29338.1 hypothetical protein B7P43_G07804 [Cryptotermes secundus]
MRALKCQEISGQYKNCTRMSPTNFEDLLMKIGPKIGKRPTNMREPISIQDGLVVTIRFLATGDFYASLQCLFRFSKQAIGQIIPEAHSDVPPSVTFFVLFIIIIFSGIPQYRE